MEKNVVGTDVNQIEITSLSHIHGQPQVTDKLSVHISAHFNTELSSKNSNSSFGPVILTGPPGTGKTMAAKAIHAVLEPYLLKEGFIIKDKSSIRLIMEKRRKHIESTSFPLIGGG